MFPDAIVTQDLKHLINRLVTELKKTSQSYGVACAMLHSAFTSNSIWVRSRNGNAYEVPGRLPDPETMIRQLDTCIASLKTLDADMFKAGFDAAVILQKVHIAQVQFKIPHHVQ